jgi:hypothetical protein
MPDQANVNEYSEDIIPLQRELEEFVGSPSVSGVSSRVRRHAANGSVSNVAGERKLHWQRIVSDMSVLRIVPLICDISIKDKSLFSFWQGQECPLSLLQMFQTGNGVHQPLVYVYRRGDESVPT